MAKPAEINLHAKWRTTNILLAVASAIRNGRPVLHLPNGPDPTSTVEVARNRYLEAVTNLGVRNGEVVATIAIPPFTTENLPIDKDATLYIIVLANPKKVKNIKANRKPN